jgi:hypothetical protein
MRIQHKFRAKPTELDGIKFASRKEAEYYRNLVMARENRELLFFLRQVPFELPGRVKYLVDFLEFWRDGEVRCVDVKGHRTEQYKAKKRMVEALYPVEIIEI